MAKVTKIIEHDWLAVRASFPDDVKANVTWSRGGEKITINPSDSAAAEALSLIVMENKRKLGKPGYSFENLGQVADAMERVAKQSRSLSEYLASLKPALDVTGERPKPKLADSAPAKTKVDLRKSRGWLVEATFPTGERFSLKINASSVALMLDPDIRSKFDEVTNLVFGIKQMGLMDDEAIANTIKSVAAESATLDDWIADTRAAFAPGAASRM